MHSIFNGVTTEEPDLFIVFMASALPSLFPSAPLPYVINNYGLLGIHGTQENIGRFGLYSGTGSVVGVPFPTHQSPTPRTFLVALYQGKKSVQTAGKFCFLHSKAPNQALTQVWHWELWMSLKEIKK